MQTLRTLGKASRDGVLYLEIPVGAPDAEFEVVVVLQPSHAASAPAALEDLGWPPHFFEETAGSIQDPTFRRHDQGEFERRPDF
jgi:hypothetical protein